MITSFVTPDVSPPPPPDEPLLPDEVRPPELPELLLEPELPLEPLELEPLEPELPELPEEPEEPLEAPPEAPPEAPLEEPPDEPPPELGFSTKSRAERPFSEWGGSERATAVKAERRISFGRCMFSDGLVE